jgi:hypothetical protein
MLFDISNKYRSFYGIPTGRFLYVSVIYDVAFKQKRPPTILIDERFG